MNVTEPVPALNRILHVLARSLPAYLASARPWATEGTAPLRLALATLADDQRRYANLVAEAIVGLGGHPSPGSYSHTFWDLNDLEPRFLLARVLQRHACDVETLRQCSHALHDHPALRDLTDEILGNAQGHQEVLEELLGRQ